MRFVLTIAAFVALAGLLGPETGAIRLAQAQECTGENCPPTTGQGRGGHECERNREDTIS